MNAFEKIEELAEDVIANRIDLVQAILSLPDDFSDCVGIVEEIPTTQINNSGQDLA